MKQFKQGERNAKFFHAYVNERRKRLRLTKIQIFRRRLEEKEEVMNETIKFFQQQFTEKTENFDILDNISKMVNADKMRV